MRKVFYFLFLFLISFILGCTNKNYVVKSSFSNKSWTRDSLWSWFVSYELAIKNLDLTGCNNLTWIYKDSCIFSIKVSLWQIKNINDCKKFSTLDITKNCEDYIYRKNYQCNKLPVLKEKKVCFDNKYYNKAITDLNLYWCLYIENDAKKKACIKNVNKLVKWKKKPFSTDSVCWNSILLKECKTAKCKAKQLFSLFLSEPSFREKEKICKKIRKIDKSMGIKCFDNFYFQKALYLMDVSLCEKVSDVNIRKQCNEETILQTALENTDIKMCKLIKNQIKKQECIDRVYLRIISRDSIKDVNICKNITSSLYKKKCYDLILKNQ